MHIEKALKNIHDVYTTEERMNRDSHTLNPATSYLDMKRTVQGSKSATLLIYSLASKRITAELIKTKHCSTGLKVIKVL